MHFEPGLNESEWDKLETKLVRIERSPDLPRLFKLVPRLVQGGQTLHVHLYSEDPWEEFAEGPYVFSYHLKGRRRQRRRAG